jgi:hypothetical protein
MFLYADFGVLPDISLATLGLVAYKNFCCALDLNGISFSYDKPVLGITI